MLVASRIFCASSALTSSVTALATVAFSRTLAGNLIDSKDLGGLQDHIRIAIIGFRFSFGPNQDDINPVTWLDKSGNAADIIHPNSHRSLSWIEHR